MFATSMLAANLLRIFLMSTASLRRIIAIAEFNRFPSEVVMRNIVGPVVTGEDFFPRPSLLERIWERIPVENILLTAPRRSGKTSIMYRLRDKPQLGYHGVSLNVEGASGAGQMLHLILKALQAHPKYTSVVKSVMSTLEGFFSRGIKVETPMGPFELGQTIEKHWEAAGEELVKRLRGIEKKEPLLLLIDEFPILLDRLRKQGHDGQQEAIQLLHWLRNLRLDPAFTDGTVRFVFSGSIGLEGAVSRLGASKSINDLYIIPVEPLAETEALDLLTRLNSKRSILQDETAHKTLLSYLEEPFPFYVQLFFDLATQHSRKINALCDAAAVERLYKTELLGLTGQTSLKHMDERLNDALTKGEAARVRELLDKVARSTKGIPFREAEQLLSGHVNSKSGSAGSRHGIDNEGDPQNIQALRDMLLHDGYLREQNGRLLFRTRLFLDFWKRHRGIRR